MPCRWANRTTTPKDQTDDKTRGRAEAGTELFNIEKPGQKVGAPLSQHVSRATGGRRANISAREFLVRCTRRISVNYANLSSSEKRSGYSLGANVKTSLSITIYW